MEPTQRGSLVWRVGIGLIVIETVVAILIGVYEYNALKAFEIERTRDSLHDVCHVIAGIWLEPLENDDPAESQRLVSPITDGSDLRITVVSADGQVVGDSHHDPADMENHKDRPEFQIALDQGEGSSERISETLGQRTMYFAKRVDAEPNVVGFVRVATPMTHVNAQLVSVVKPIAIGAAMWIGVTILSIAFLSSRLSSVIGRLGADATRLATSEPTSSPLVAPGREFQPFVDSFNEMASLLRDRIDELRSNQQEQVTILRSMESGVIALDRDRRVLRLNPAAQRMLHMPEAHARGKTLAEVAPKSRLAAHVSDAFQTGRITTEEIEFDDPGRFVVRAASSVLREPDGEAVGLLIMLTDVTRIRRLESMRSDFAANVSHELRTPITNIQGFAETLLSMPPDDTDEHREFLAIIAKNAVRLGSIVEDLLTLSRLEREESLAGLDTLPTPVVRIVETVLDVLRPNAGEAHITFKTDIQPSLIAMANEHLIEQAITNLLTNAIRHSPQDAAVTIRAHTSTLDTGAPAVEIRVEDEGPGIPEEHLSRLFERFFRLDKSRGRTEGGTGLGLAIVKHIVLVHDGSVDVESELGNGTTFRIRLPAP